MRLRRRPGIAAWHPHLLIIAEYHAETDPTSTMPCTRDTRQQQALCYGGVGKGIPVDFSLKRVQTMWL